MSEDQIPRMRYRLEIASELVLDLPHGVYLLCSDLANALPDKASGKVFVDTAQKLLDEIAADVSPNSEYIDVDAGELVARARRSGTSHFRK